MVNENTQATFNHLLSAVSEERRRTQKTVADYPWNVPFRRNPFFTGREDLLNSLHHQLTDGHAAALTQFRAITGLGGIGKTQTAIEYAYRYREAYQAIFWVRAASRDTLAADFVALANLLSLP